MRDEINQPLGIGPNAAASASRGRAGAFAAVATLVAAAAVAGELSFLRSASPRMGGAVAVAAAERFGAPAELPPLRLTETLAPLPKQPQAPALADRGAEPNAAKPARVRPGAPEPLIIDVQQALAALRVKDGSAAPP